MEEFCAMVQYFGEDPHIVTTADVFNIFYSFLEKFEVRGHCIKLETYTFKLPREV
jgi:hypothetical protein